MESSNSTAFEIFAKFFSNSWNELMEMKYLIKYLLFGLIRRSKTYRYFSVRTIYSLSPKNHVIYSLFTIRIGQYLCLMLLFKSFKEASIASPRSRRNHSNRLRLYLCRKTFQGIHSHTKCQTYIRVIVEKILQGTKKIIRVKGRFEL